MTLNKETRFGLTFGQILSTITIFISIMAAWIAINIKIAQAEVRIEKLERDRQENREDHIKIMEKLDKLIYKLNE